MLRLADSEDEDLLVASRYTGHRTWVDVGSHVVERLGAERLGATSIILGTAIIWVTLACLR